MEEKEDGGGGGGDNHQPHPTRPHMHEEDGLGGGGMERSVNTTGAKRSEGWAKFNISNMWASFGWMCAPHTFTDSNRLDLSPVNCGHKRQCLRGITQRFHSITPSFKVW